MERKFMNAAAYMKMIDKQSAHYLVIKIRVPFPRYGGNEIRPAGQVYPFL
jgi:hypothetical protein